MTDINFIIRSLLIFPGHVDKFFISAMNSDADAIAIDLEDAVPESYKKKARDAVIEKLESIGKNKVVFVRVNSISSGLIESDIESTMHDNLSGYVLPMIKDRKEIAYIDRVVSKIERDRGLIQGKIKFFPLIEQSAAVLNAINIAQASKRNIGLIFGHEDFLLDIHAPQTNDRNNLFVARSIIVMAARAIGGMPIDAPFLNISDMSGFSESTVTSKSLGFSGILAIHKNQVLMANSNYMPSNKEMNEAKAIVKQVELSKKEGRSISFSNGRFAGPPIVKHAKQVLKEYEYFKDKNKLDEL